MDSQSKLYLYGHPSPLVSFDDTSIQIGIEGWEQNTDPMFPTFEPTRCLGMIVATVRSSGTPSDTSILRLWLLCHGRRSLLQAEPVILTEAATTYITKPRTVRSSVNGISWIFGQCSHC